MVSSGNNDKAALRAGMGLRAASLRQPLHVHTHDAEQDLLMSPNFKNFTVVTDVANLPHTSTLQRYGNSFIYTLKTALITAKTRKPCCRKETARCRKCSFRLKFANNIPYKYKTSHMLRKQRFRAPNMLAQNTI